VACNWKYLENDVGKWFGLALELPAGAAPHKPALRIETGNNGRIRLAQHDTPLLWASIHKDYGGVDLLRSFAALPQAPVAPGTLDSARIEKQSALAPDARLQSWSRFFAEALLASPGAFLHLGLWLFAGLSPRQPRWSFASEPFAPHAGWQIHDLEHEDRDDRLSLLDWSASRGYRIVRLKAPLPAEDGRLKWWRKKAREGSLPPVLLWFVGCHDALVVVDGHNRLQAAILEDSPPEFIVAYPAQEMPVQPDPVARQAMLDSLEGNDKRRANRPGRQEALNQALLSAFDDRPYVRPRSRGWASIASDEHWIAEVRTQLAAANRLDALPRIVARQR
jgi:hypothetical protein